MKLDFTFVLIGALVVGLGVYGAWQYTRLQHVQGPPPANPNRISVPLW